VSKSVFNLLSLATVLFLGLPAALAQTPPATDTNDLTIDWLAVEGINQPVTHEQTGVAVTYSLDGKEVESFVPVEADTYLGKDSDVSQGDGASLVLRDNRYSEVLIRLDLSALPKGAQVSKASLQVPVHGVEKKGAGGTVSCFQVLTPWSENATWHLPQPNQSASWNGLQAKKDFNPTAFAQLQVQSLDDKQHGGQVLSVPNFETALQQWQSGGWANNGFLVTFSGAAVQFAFPSRESLDKVRAFQLGGTGQAKVLLKPNWPLLSHLVIKPDDLVAALPQLTLEKATHGPAFPTDGTIKIFQVKGEDVSTAQPLGEFALKDATADGLCALPDVSKFIREGLAPGGEGMNLLVEADGNGLEIGGTIERGRKPELLVKIRPATAAQLFNLPVKPEAGVYTKVVDGHLNYHGKRLRLWGVVGYPDPARLVEMGFNAQRVWEPSAKVGPTNTYSADSVLKGEFAPYTKGDGSQMDLADKHFADLKSHGLFVMFGAVSGSVPYQSAAVDGSFISGGDDWAQWKEAIQPGKDGDFAPQYIYVDERLQKLKLQHAKNILTHVNPYTGKAYGEEENIAIYEVYNENGFVSRILGGSLDKWSGYFKAKLQKQWNDWLVAKYANDDGLKKAWGKLGDNEALSQGSVLPAPDFENRTKYPEARGNDFVHFVVDLENQLHEKFRSYCRSLYPAGVGVNVVPFSFDTMYRPSLQWAYDESRGDVFSDGMYYWDLKSLLDKPPSSYLIDSFTPEKKPVVLYETNIGRPNSFRAEYPLKLAALASYQDWDGVFWHYWGPVGTGGDLAYLNVTMPPPAVTHYWNAVHHEGDPVMCTSMSLASRIFLGQYLPPAADPAVIKVGGQALFSYSLFRGIGLGQETFSRGTRLQFAPEDNSALTLNGGPLPVSGRLEHAVASGPYVKWDWPNGRLIIDAPAMKAYVGKVNGSFRFSDGITLGNVNVPWVAFCMESGDGKPLAGAGAASRILMGAVADAKNSGFSFNYNVVGGPQEQAKAVHDAGHPPVLVDKVNYTVWFPQKVTGTLKSYDFALREMQSVPLADVNQVDQRGDTPYLDELSVNAWGGDGSLPLAEATAINTDNPAPVAPPAGISGADGSGLLSPIPGVDWSMSYVDAHKVIENSSLVFTTLSPLDATSAPEKTIAITDMQSGFWGSTVDAALIFQGGKSKEVELTFKEPPPIEDMIGKISGVSGDPSEKKLDAQYGTTRIVWKATPKSPAIEVTESQGILKMLYKSPDQPAE
jgi:hypothetical protein